MDPAPSLLIIPFALLAFAGCVMEPRIEGAAVPWTITNHDQRDRNVQATVLLPEGGELHHTELLVRAGSSITASTPQVSYGTYVLKIESDGQRREAEVDFDASDQEFRFVIEPTSIGFQAR